MGAVPTAWRATAQENAAASKAEREGLGVRFAGAWGRALIVHILA